MPPGIFLASHSAASYQGNHQPSPLELVMGPDPEMSPSGTDYSSEPTRTSAERAKDDI